MEDPLPPSAMEYLLTNNIEQVRWGIIVC